MSGGGGDPYRGRLRLPNHPGDTGTPPPPPPSHQFSPPTQDEGGVGDLSSMPSEAPVALSTPPPPPPPSADQTHDSDALPHLNDKPHRDHFESHIPLALGANENECITINSHKFFLALDSSEKKAHNFSYSGYVIAAFGLLVHIVVFIMCLFTGSPVAASVYVASFASEGIAVVAISVRAFPGSMKALSFAKLWCGTFTIVELGLAIATSVTNWVHFEAPRFRWVAVALTYVHFVLLLELVRCIVNVRHAKKQICYRATQLETSRSSLRGPLLDEEDSVKKGT